jgi:hypothetical protein
MKLTNIKTVILGSKVKFLHFNIPISYGFENLAAKNKSRVFELNPDEDLFSYAEESARKARGRIRNIIWSNACQYFKEKGKPFKPQFSTFTFNHDVLDFQSGQQIFNNFKKRLDYKLGKSIVCLSVPEFQKDIDFQGNKKPNGGRVHYHTVFFNLPYINNLHEFLAQTWGNGFVLNKSTKSVEHLANYVCKYIQKDLENKHIKFKKRYLVSRGIKRPVEIYDEEFAADFKNYISTLETHQTKEVEYDSLDGRHICQEELIFPDGFNLADLVNKTPQDTVKLAKKIFGIDERDKPDDIP